MCMSYKLIFGNASLGEDCQILIYNLLADINKFIMYVMLVLSIIPYYGI